MMAAAQWSLAAVMMGAQWFIASRRRGGWLLAFVGQLGLITYTVVTEQYGFVPLNAWGAAMAVRGWRNHFKTGR